MASLGKEFKISCGNSCRWGAPGGMGTNGGCHCFDNLSVTDRMEMCRGIALLRELAELPYVMTAIKELVQTVQINAIEEEETTT